jgi:hypothetical protein
MTTTNTPRTDEQIWTTEYHHELCDVVDMSFARQLETELQTAKDDLESVRPALNAFEHVCERLDEVGSQRKRAVKIAERLIEIINERDSYEISRSEVSDLSSELLTIASQH